MIEIEIDGKKCEVEPGSMIIQAADDAGISIPRFCYHKKLSIAANCRMCLVHVEKSPKPLPACATPVAPGMVVHTKTEEARAAQRSVMEFLLINHPLDCPICDQGGQCELQDLAMGYGKDASRFTLGKRSVADKNIGSLIATEMTRCIHCTRCVRFGDEIAGVREMGLTGRGEHTEVGTYIEKNLVSELSGNVIDLCPVGALTSKPFRFKARAWELSQTPSISTHDCVGSNLYVHHLRQKVMRVVPRENEAINESWIADRDRFSYEGLLANDRLANPLMKVKGEWREVDWQTALNAVVDGLSKVINAQTANQMGAQVSPSATTEEMYLLQKLMRDLGSHHIDHRLQQNDFSDQNYCEAYPRAALNLEQLSEQQAILLIGSNVRFEQPIVGHRLRQASLKGASVMAINPMAYSYHFNLAEEINVSPDALPQALAAVAKVVYQPIMEKAFPGAGELLAEVPTTKEAKAIASHLQQQEKAALILGAAALNHPQASAIRALAQLIAEATSASISFMTPGANAAGAWLAGAIPHRGPAAITVLKPGMDSARQWQAGLRGYILLGVEPECDAANAYAAQKALQAADFVVSITPFIGQAKQYADVILPSVPFTETSGTYINAMGDWQSVRGVVPAFGEARPAWKILRVLGNLFQLDGYEYQSSEEVRDELKQLTDEMTGQGKHAWQCPSVEALTGKVDENSLQRYTDWPIYRSDALVRRSQPLQQSGLGGDAFVAVHPSLASRLGLEEGKIIQVRQGEAQVSLPLQLDSRLSENTVYVPAGYEATVLGESFGKLELE